MQVSPCSLVLIVTVSAVMLIFTYVFFWPALLRRLRKVRGAQTVLAFGSILLLVQIVRTTTMVPCNKDVALQDIRKNIPALATVTTKLPEVIGCGCAT